MEGEKPQLSRMALSSVHTCAKATDDAKLLPFNKRMVTHIVPRGVWQ